MNSMFELQDLHCLIDGYYWLRLSSLTDTSVEFTKVFYWALWYFRRYIGILSDWRWLNKLQPYSNGKYDEIGEIIS